MAGLGSVPLSARAIAPAFAEFDAETRFAISEKQSRETKSCECPAILRGVKSPKDCKLFGRACTPETPLGACMVSSEGSCAAYYTYRRAETMAQMDGAQMEAAE
jgi:hydrogenase expression/formation protein HypD